MGLSCSCDEFYKGDFENWWEIGRRMRPPESERCCECNAPLDTEDALQTILHWEVFTPKDQEPPNVEYDGEIDGIPQQTTYPWNVNGLSKAQLEEIRICRALWEERFGPIEQWYIHQREEWETRNGYDNDTDRCERVSVVEFRCDRCQGIAEAIEELGYCLVGPGEVVGAHMEYIEQSGRRPMLWESDASGTLNPRRCTDTEIAIAKLRQAWRTAKFRSRYWLKYTLPYRVKHRWWRLTSIFRRT